MPQIDFKKPMTFLNTLEPFALALNCALVALRNEVQFQERRDQAVIDAAAMLSSMLEDAHVEVERLTDQLERRSLSVS